MLKFVEAASIAALSTAVGIFAGGAIALLVIFAATVP